MSQSRRAKELHAMNKEELMGTILHLEAKQRNHDLWIKQKNDLIANVIKTANQRVQVFKCFKQRMAQMHIIPEQVAGDFIADKKAFANFPDEKASTAREELLKKAQDDFNLDSERFFKKKADQRSTTITIMRSASRLEKRGP